MTRKYFTMLIVSLVLSVAIINCFYSSQKRSASNVYLHIFPERFRSFIAGYLWERADRLMHEGPIITNQKFSAGSYAGNTDIVPLLKMVIALCPEQTVPYRLLATNYAYHLNMGNEALNLLDEAKKNCAENQNYHEIFSTEALIRLYLGRNSEDKRQNLEKVISLFDEAILKYKKDTQFPDPAYTLENYTDVKNSLQNRLNNLDVFLKSEVKPSDDSLLLNEEYYGNQAEYSSHFAEKQHEYTLNRENLLSFLFKLVIKAGLVTGLMLISCFSRLKSF